MVINGNELLALEPIKDMLKVKMNSPVGVSFGLSEAGYDIRVKQEIVFSPLSNEPSQMVCCVDGEFKPCARFTLASAIEEFDMPASLVGVVHDKSTWARKGLSVFNTVIEPGWKGYLTLELVYHGSGELVIPAGSGIAQVLFHETSVPANYKGKYQNQPDEPTEGNFVPCT